MSLALIDGTNVVMRWAAAMTDGLETSEPKRSQVLNAVNRVLHEFVTAVGATHAIVAFDSNLATWRASIYPEYKANRSPSRTGAWSNVGFMFLRDAGWLCQRAPGFEADDVVATLATRGRRREAEVHMLSGDSDLAVLIKPDVRLWTFGTKGLARFTEVTIEKVCRKYGITEPALLRDWKAIVGEVGDHIPGVPGLGPIKTQRLLATHGTLMRAISARAIPDEHHAVALLAYRLVGLATDVDVAPILPTTCRVPNAPEPPAPSSRRPPPPERDLGVRGGV